MTGLKILIFENFFTNHKHLSPHLKFKSLEKLYLSQQKKHILIWCRQDLGFK